LENENENVKVKKTPKGLIIGIIAAVIIIAICIVLFILKPWSAGYVGNVDNQKITKQEYMVFSKSTMNSFLTNNSISTEAGKYDWKNTKVKGETAKDQVKKETLNQIQEIKIIVLKAKEAGMKLEDKELTDIDSSIISQYGDEAAAEQAIKSAYGVSLSEFKEVFKEISLYQKYVTAERSKATVSDDETKKYYDEKKKDFDKVTVTHILISTVDANNVAVSAGKKSEANQKAKDLLKQVQAGGDIKALAEKNSEDPGVKENKGEYTFSKGEMTPEFEDWAFASHAIGDTGIVESSFGFHVMKFEKRVETAYDDVKDKIKTSLITSKFSEDFTKKMDGWKKEAKYVVVQNKSVLEKTDLIIYGS